TNVNSPVSWSGVGGYAHSGDTALLTTTTQFLSGNYTATVSGNGCASKSATNMLVIAAPPSLNITATSLPEGCEGQGNGSIHVDVNGGSGSYKICYTQFVNCVTPVTSADFKYLAPSTYTISVSDITCPNGYSTTTSVVGVGTHVDAPLTASYNAPVCEGDDLVLTATGANTGHYLWTDTKNNFTDTGIVITRSNAQVEMSSNYKVQHVVDGCASQALFVDVIVFGTPIISSVDTLCMGIASEDSGRIVINSISNGATPLEYALNGGAFQTSNTFDRLTNGLYQVSVRPTGSDCETTMRDINLYCACVCNKEATVTIFPNPNNGVFSVNANLLEPSADIVITMYDLKGGKIYEQSLNAEAGNLTHEIQLKNYAVGTYMLRVKIDENVFIIPVSCN
ncbi:MAG TPA: T9SS type A sorting domain-containing protein, partial [Chitinophagaceae bacterium]|nr:T9SS type A sorting domain-containing protein [Chitinophagaceae bacterium]